MRVLTPAELKAIDAYIETYPELQDLAKAIHESEEARRTLAFNIAILGPPRSLDATAIARACLIDT